MSPTVMPLTGEGLDIGLDRRLKICAECEGMGIVFLDAGSSDVYGLLTTKLGRTDPLFYHQWIELEGDSEITS